MGASKKKQKLPILLYIPNLIGYARVALLGVFYAAALDRPALALAAYVASFAGDLFDGYFAKKYDQRSTFGGVLDMVTDRVATAGLLSFLGILYPRRAGIFTALQTLDIASHWFHMYSTASAAGDASKHHKAADALRRRNVVLRIYYASYPLFAYLCVSAELTYVALYAIAADICPAPARPAVETLYVVALLPGCVAKQVVNVAQLASAAAELARRDTFGEEDAPSLGAIDGHAKKPS